MSKCSGLTKFRYVITIGFVCRDLYLSIYFQIITLPKISLKLPLDTNCINCLSRVITEWSKHSRFVLLIWNSNRSSIKSILNWKRKKMTIRWKSLLKTSDHKKMIRVDWSEMLFFLLININVSLLVNDSNKRKHSLGFHSCFKFHQIFISVFRNLLQTSRDFPLPLLLDKYLR